MNLFNKAQDPVLRKHTFYPNSLVTEERLEKDINLNDQEDRDVKFFVYYPK